MLKTAVGVRGMIEYHWYSGGGNNFSVWFVGNNALELKANPSLPLSHLHSPRGGFKEPRT